MNRSKMSKISNLAVLLMLPLAAMYAPSAEAAANFPVGTHLYKGTLKDWQNKVLTSSAPVTIQAVSANGTVIASTKVADPSADGYNFLLQIPLSSTATDYTAAVGDTLRCVLVRDTGLSFAVDPLTVGEANTVSEVSLAFVNVREYTSTTDPSKTVGVPVEYIDTIASWMEAYEIDGDYDPFADYDDDGVSNYDEYRAGTNPFDATDKLAITAYSASNDALHAISFEYVGGHVYGVTTTLSLMNPEWATQPLRKTDEGAEYAQVVPSANDEDVGVTTIYVVPAEGATSQFFKLEAK